MEFNKDMLSAQDVQEQEAPEVAPMVSSEDEALSIELAQEKAASVQQTKERKSGKASGPRAVPGHFLARRSGMIHSASGRTDYEDEAEVQRKRALLDIFQSYNRKRRLTGTVKGVKPVFKRGTGHDDDMPYYVVVAYGPYQVYIPDTKFTEMSPETVLAIYRQRDPNCTMANAMKIYLQSRINAQVEFVVTDLPNDGSQDERESTLVGGDRAEAMYRSRVNYWFGKQNNGADLINEGDIAMARIICTSRQAIRVELFGVETSIRARELSWSMIQDVAENDKFQAGKEIKILITSITRNEADYSVEFTASVKRADPDPRIAGLRLYSDFGVYLGTIRYIEPPSAETRSRGGVFVELDEGVQCMCPFPNGTVPPSRGCKCYVFITNHDDEKLYLYGRITYIITQRQS